MVLCELLGEDAYRARAKIYATDIDDQALEQARAASYLPKQVEGVPDDLLGKYFGRRDQRYAFRPDLRRTVIFGRNDIVQDAPISRVDLLICRNTLMYFNADTQAEVLRRFHFALRDDAILLLGKSEMLITHSDLFEPLDLRRRMFRRVPRNGQRDRLAALTRSGEGVANGAGALQREAFDRSNGAQVVIDVEGTLVAANSEARGTFTLTDSDIGRPLQDLELSYRPVELRSHIDRVVRDRRPLRLNDLHSDVNGGEERVFEVRLSPLISGEEELLGTAIAFLDVSTHHKLQNALSTSKRELEDAYEELQSTVEELETTNEELQSTNEELETTNEELQSTNEELETMNEELHSSNEELETMNDELRMRSLELDEVNAFLETILTSMGLAVTVVNRHGVIQVWNSHAQGLWGLGGEEVEGQHFLGLDIGLPVEQLKTPIRKALGEAQERSEVVLDATNRRGKQIRCRVTVMALGPGDEPTGAILLMSELPPGAADS
jgi:two-component system CheB/CheR fusion protein